jgi:hypothetical protein
MFSMFLRNFAILDTVTLDDIKIQYVLLILGPSKYYILKKFCSQGILRFLLTGTIEAHILKIVL